MRIVFCCFCSFIVLHLYFSICWFRLDRRNVLTRSYSFISYHMILCTTYQENRTCRSITVLHCDVLLCIAPPPCVCSIEATSRGGCSWRETNVPSSNERVHSVLLCQNIHSPVMLETGAWLCFLVCAPYHNTRMMILLLILRR